MDFKKLIRKRKPSEYFLYLGVIALGVFLDQLTKWLAVEYLTKVTTVPIIKGVIHLTYLENPGAAFGSFADAPWVFNTVSTVAIIAMLLYLFSGRCSNALEAISIAMIVSGGIGNMIDRLTLGYVVDFIDFRLINFAIFNGADSFVCVGAGILILSLSLELAREIKAERSRTSGGDGKN